MELDNLLKLITAVGVANLIAVLIFGFKIIRFFGRFEREHEILWQDYEYRMKLYKNAHEHQYDSQQLGV